MTTATKTRNQNAPKQSTAAPVSDEKIASFFADLQPKEREKLKRCVSLEVARMGYDPKTVLENSRTWEKGKRAVASNLIEAGQTLRDVEFSEDE